MKLKIPERHKTLFKMLISFGPERRASLFAQIASIPPYMDRAGFIDAARAIAAGDNEVFDLFELLLSLSGGFSTSTTNVPSEFGEVVADSIDFLDTDEKRKLLANIVAEAVTIRNLALTTAAITSTADLGWRIVDASLEQHVIPASTYYGELKPLLVMHRFRIVHENQTDEQTITFWLTRREVREIIIELEESLKKESSLNTRLSSVQGLLSSGDDNA